MSQTYISVTIRREVIERAGGCCEYCRLSQAVGMVDFALDHAIAEKHGGTTTADNLSFTCFRCNSYKGSDISSVDWDETGDIVPLFNPRKQNWSDHFILDGAFIKPLTAAGRVTIFLLRINAPERITEREVLVLLGEFPC